MCIFLEVSFMDKYWVTFIHKMRVKFQNWFTIIFPYEGILHKKISLNKKWMVYHNHMGKGVRLCGMYHLIITL